VNTSLFSDEVITKKPLDVIAIPHDVTLSHVVLRRIT